MKKLTIKTCSFGYKYCFFAVSTSFANAVLYTSLRSCERPQKKLAFTPTLFYYAFFAVSTSFANAVLSQTAMSAKTLRLRSIFAFFKPAINLL